MRGHVIQVVLILSVILFSSLGKGHPIEDSDAPSVHLLPPELLPTRTPISRHPRLQHFTLNGPSKDFQTGSVFPAPMAEDASDLAAIAAPLVSSGSGVARSINDEVNDDYGVLISRDVPFADTLPNEPVWVERLNKTIQVKGRENDTEKYEEATTEAYPKN